MPVSTILRRAWAASLLAAVFAPAALLMVPTVLLAPIFGWVVAACLRAHLRAVIGAGDDALIVDAAMGGSDRSVAALALVVAGLTGAGMVGAVVGGAAGVALAPSAPTWGAAAGAALVPVLGLVMLAPLIFAPVVWLERSTRDRRLSTRLAAVLGSALEAWRASPRGARWRPLVVAAAPWLAGATLVGAEAPAGRWMGVLGPVVALAVPLACAALVAAWVPVRAHALAYRPQAHPPRGLAVLAASTLLASVVALGGVAWALVTPLPMTEVTVGRAASRALQPPWSGWRRGAFVLPGTQLQVRPDRRGVRIEAPDGGGAGLVRLRGGADVVRAESVDGGYRVHAEGPQGRGVVAIDRAGVRQDDTFHDRVRVRLGSLGLLLLLAMAGGWGATALAGVRLQRASRLRDLPATDAPQQRAKETCVLQGRLTLGPGARLRREGARLVADGPAWIVGGDLRVALPPEGVRVRGGSESLGDGDEVALVGRFGQRAGAAFREATVRWPSGARLVLGGRDAAVRGAVRRASAVAALALTATLATALGLVLWVLRST